MDRLFANNAESALVAGIAAGDLALTVGAADAAKFPNPIAGKQFFPVTIMRRNTGVKEIVWCTARAGQVLTIVRAKEGTAAVAFVAGDVVSYRPTSGFAADATYGKHIVRSIKHPDYACKDDGVTDNYAAMNQAMVDLAADGGGTLWLPPTLGAYGLATMVPVLTGCEVVGAGERSLVRCSGNNFAFSIAGDRTGCRNFAVDAANVQAAGGGITFLNAGSNHRARDLFMGSKLFYGLDISPAAGAVGIYDIEGVRWNGIASSNTGVRIGDGVHLVTDVTLSKLVGTAATNADMDSWLRVRNNSDTVTVRDSIFVKCGAAGGSTIEVGANAAGSVTGMRMFNVVSDTGLAYGLNVQKCRDLQAFGCSIQTMANGLTLGGLVSGFKWIGGAIQNNQGWGVIVSAGADAWMIKHANVVDNNQAGGAFANGIDVAAGVSNFHIVDNDIGNFLLTPAGQQKTGIVVAVGASANYFIFGNRLRGNVTAGLTDGGAGAKYVPAGSNL